MKRIINMNKYLIGAIMGIILVSTISVFAIEGVKAVIKSEEVSYDNTKSHGTYQDVQGSIDELYRRSGILDKEWKDPILNGADPVLKDPLIPVTIDDDGTVHYANLYTKWYEYETKRWANAIILNNTGKTKSYKTGDTIKEEDIESYFVWIPRYKYKIWNLGKYDKVYNFSDLKDLEDIAKTEDDIAGRRIVASTRLINIIFQKAPDKTSDSSGECASSQISGGGDNCHTEDYMTHPAFTLGVTELNGLWVGKFEMGGTESNIVVKPNVISWKNATVGTFWNKLYNYKRNLDSHMMKNTEWGAVAYLSHSMYGIGRKVNINNNSDYLTGYSASTITNQYSVPGDYGNTDSMTMPWNTPTGYLASTTGNITGVYDMSGGAYEYMAAYRKNRIGNSNLTSEELNTYNEKYFNQYENIGSVVSNGRIIGDATGEMGPFYYYYDKDGRYRIHNVWYGDFSLFIDYNTSWFVRGCYCSGGVLASQFSFDRSDGGMSMNISTRITFAL